jgi:hypothetical protein
MEDSSAVRSVKAANFHLVSNQLSLDVVLDACTAERVIGRALVCGGYFILAKAAPALDQGRIRLRGRFCSRRWLVRSWCRRSFRIIYVRRLCPDKQLIWGSVFNQKRRLDQLACVTHITSRRCRTET